MGLVGPQLAQDTHHDTDENVALLISVRYAQPLHNPAPVPVIIMGRPTLS